MILGSILLDGSKYATVVGAVTQDVFSLQKHQLIWQRMSDLAERSEVIDRVTVTNELIRHSELDSAGGLGYLISLDDGLPQIASIDAYVRIVVEKWRLRKAIFAAQRTINQAFSGEYTADEVTLNGQAMLAEEAGGYGSSQIESVQAFVETFPGGLNRFLNPSAGDRGISTGFRDLDEVTDGFHATEIFLVGARPSHGKTAFGSCVAKSVARAGRSVAVFSLELSKSMLVHRMICEEAYVSYFRFRQGLLDEGDRARVREATSTIMGMPLYIDDASGSRVADIRVKLNRIMRERPVDLMVIDYAQLVKPPKGMRFGTENDKFTAIGEELKHLSKDTKIPMLLLSQLNRESEKDKGDNLPKLSQARGAGVWEEISFVGATLYREWLRKRERDDLREQAKLFVEKNRSGPASTITLRFQPWLMRFADMLDAPPPAQPAS